MQARNRPETRSDLQLCCELPCHSAEYVLLHCFNAQPYIFAVVNSAGIALSVFYSPVLARGRIFLQLCTISVECCLCPGLLNWSADNCSLP